MATLSGTPSASDSDTLVLTTSWLKDPLDPTRNTAVDLVVWDPQEHHTAGVFYPRRDVDQAEADGDETARAVVVQGPIYGEEGTATFRTWNRAAFDTVRRLLRSRRTLLLQRPTGEQWYLRVSGHVGRRQIRALPRPDETTPVRHAHELTVPLHEVKAPA